MIPGVGGWNLVLLDALKERHRKLMSVCLEPHTPKEIPMSKKKDAEPAEAAFSPSVADPEWHDYQRVRNRTEAYLVTKGHLAKGEDVVVVPSEQGDLQARPGDYVVITYTAGTRVTEIHPADDFEVEYERVPDQNDQLLFEKAVIACKCGGVHTFKEQGELTVIAGLSLIRKIHKGCFKGDAQGKLPGA